MCLKWSMQARWLFYFYVGLINTPLFTIRFPNLSQIDWQAGAIKISKRLLVTYMIGFIAFSSVGLGFLFNPWSTTEAEAAWFNDSWTYRKPITFTHNATVSNPTQVELDIDTSGAPELIQSDCGDIRFTDINGNILDYYYDSAAGACDTISTDFDVLVPTISNGSNIIYMYYGNPSAMNGYLLTDFAEATTTPSGGAPAQGTEAKAPSPVAYWKLDDGQGQTAQDSTSSNYDGTLGSTSGTDATDPLWRQESSCVSGMCMEFDGSDDFLDAGTNSTLNATTNFSVSLWVKFTYGTGNQVMISKGTQGNLTNWHIIYVPTGGTNQKVYFGIYNGISTYFNLEPAYGKWYQLTATLTQSGGNSIVNTYVDGQLKDSQTGTSLSSVSGKNLYIGQYADPGAQNLPFNGILDEVKYYNFPLTANQVRSNYNAAANPEGVSTALGGNTQNLKGALSDGLIGYWKMDEASANTCLGGANDNCDSSGLGLDGSWNGNATSGVGKFGNSASFDGNGDYTVATATPAHSAGTYTVSWWMNAATAIDTTISHPIYKASNALNNRSNYAFSWGHSTASFQQACIHSVGGTFSVAAKLTTSLTNGTWYHITCMYDGTNLKAYLNGNHEASVAIGAPDTGTVGFYMGTGYSNGPSGYFNGRVDEVRIYNRSLSDEEIKQVANWAPGPVGYWNFDEKSGQTINDLSGNTNSGTLGSDSNPATDDPTWTTGKFNNSLSFDGSNDLANIPDPASGILDITGPVTVSAWIKYSSGDYRAIVSKGATSCATNCPFDFYVDNSGFLTFVRAGATFFYGVRTAATVPTNQWVHVTAIADGSVHRLYINGVESAGALATGSAGTYQVPVANASDVRIGRRADSVPEMLGNIDELKIYNYARTKTQIVEDMNGGHPAPGSPVGSAFLHMKFDEGADNTCSGGTNDVCNSGSGGSSLDSASTASRTNSGKFNKALDFDGSDDNVVIANQEAVDLNVNLVTGFTFSAWINPDDGGDSGGNGTVFFKDNTTDSYLAVSNLTGSTVDLSAQLDLTADATLSIPTAITVGTWNHIALTYADDEDDEIEIYINGVLRGTSTNGSGVPGNDTANLLIGGMSTFNFDGKIDEVKMYGSALNSEQIKIDMNRSVSQALGGTGVNTNFATGADAQKYCIPGDSATCTAPVGEWLFNERTGSTVNDTSGSGNTGTWQGTLGSQWSVKGRGSGSGNFNGTDNYLTVTDASGLSSTTLSQEAWVYPRANGTWASIINRRTAINTQGWTMEQNFTTNSLQCQYGISGPTRTANATTALTVNAWNHVACSYDGSSVRAFVNGKLEGVFNASGSISNPGSTAINIGRNVVDSSYYTGLIDMVRVFGYARTPAQIAYSASDGKPWAHWKMDECQGGTINDSSGRSYTGTWNGTGGGGNTSAGTCAAAGTAWGDGATGKKNASLEFDGTDDYVQVADTSYLRFDSAAHDLSIFGWVKRAANGEMNVISKEDADNDGWRMQFNSSNQVVCSEDATDVTSTTAITDTNWHQIGCSIDRDGNGQVYIDGKPDGAAVAMGTDAMATTSNIRIGTRSYTSANYFTGQIDDLRVYIYPVTQTQVELIMNEGAYRVGPTEGAP